MFDINWNPSRQFAVLSKRISKSDNIRLIFSKSLVDFGFCNSEGFLNMSNNFEKRIKFVPN